MSTPKLHFPPHNDEIHAWLPTASPLIERCSRPSCRAIRQWRNSAWIEVEPVRQKRTTIVTQQPSLWA